MGDDCGDRGGGDEVVRVYSGGNSVFPDCRQCNRLAGCRCRCQCRGVGRAVCYGRTCAMIVEQRRRAVLQTPAPKIWRFKGDTSCVGICRKIGHCGICFIGAAAQVHASYALWLSPVDVGCRDRGAMRWRCKTPTLARSLSYHNFQIIGDLSHRQLLTCWYVDI